MIPSRQSSAESSNANLRYETPVEGEGNLAWLSRVGATAGIALLGGASLADFRLRFAQSALRSDLTPSYWSQCGILDGAGGLFTVPFVYPDVSEVAKTNAVRVVPLSDFDDPALWPNIALLRFADWQQPVIERAQRVRDRRTIIDLPRLLLAWLEWVWAAGDGTDPFSQGHGMPGAAFVEMTYSLANIDLTPGLSSAASCPEAIWQAVKWWHEYYAEARDLGVGTDAKPIVPEGVCGVRQKSAAVLLPPDAPLFAPEPGPPPDAGAAPAPPPAEPAPPTTEGGSEPTASA